MYTPKEGEKTVLDVYDFEGPGVAMSMYNTEEVRVDSVCEVLEVC